jgi:hypothetical protein
MFKKSLIATSTWSDEDRCYIGERPELFSASMAMMLRQSPRELRQAVAQNVILHQSRARRLNHIRPPLSKNRNPSTGQNSDASEGPLIFLSSFGSTDISLDDMREPATQMIP